MLGDFSSGPQAAGAALARLKPCGDYHAATIDAVYYAIHMLNGRQTHYRRAILLISETRDHGSRSKLEEVVTELGVTDTVIYSAAFSPTRDEFIQDLRYGDNKPPPAALPAPKPSGEADSAPATPEPDYQDHAPRFSLPPYLMTLINALRRNSASEIASLSGGEYLNFTTRKGLENGLQRISNRIHDYYLLSFQPTSSAAAGPHTLKVQIAGYPDAVIQTRRSYWAGIPEVPPGGARK